MSIFAFLFHLFYFAQVFCWLEKKALINQFLLNNFNGLIALEIYVKD